MSLDFVRDSFTCRKYLCYLIVNENKLWSQWLGFEQKKCIQLNIKVIWVFISKNFKCNKCSVPTCKRNNLHFCTIRMQQLLIQKIHNRVKSKILLIWVSQSEKWRINQLRKRYFFWSSKVCLIRNRAFMLKLFTVQNVGKNKLLLSHSFQKMLLNVMVFHKCPNPEIRIHKLGGYLILLL